MKRPNLPPLNLPLAGAMISWAINFGAIKVLYREMAPPALAMMRFVGMYVALLAICGIQGLSLRMERKDLLKITLLGALSMGIYMVAFLEGMQRTTPYEGAIVMATGPILTGLLAVAFKQEHFGIRAYLGALLGFGGVALVVTEGAKISGHGWLGNGLVFAGAILWSFSAIVMRSLLGKYQPLQLLTMAMPGSLLVLVPYSFNSMLEAPWTHMSAGSWWWLAYMAVGSGALGFAGFYSGVRKVGAGGAMLYQYFVPPLTALFAWILLGQTLNLTQFIGMGVVLAGVGISMHYREAGQLHRANTAAEPAV